MYVGRIEKLLTHYSMVPMCIINSFGKVTRANKKIADVFKYDGIVDNDIFVLTGIKLPEVMAATKEKRTLFLKKNGKAFKILTSFIGEGDTASIVMSFIDMTSFENLKDLYNEEKPCIALINVDNLEEMTPSGMEESEMEVSTEVDKLIRNWSAKMGAAISRYKEHMYEMLLTHKNYRELVESKFDILDEVRKIETDMDFPVTLSIGIGIGGKTIAESEDYAQDALNLALGRGGDQAVVRGKVDFQFYGGRSKSTEKRTKVKSRVMASALNELMADASEIYIMGHSFADMDAVGAAGEVGIMQLNPGPENTYWINLEAETELDPTTPSGNIAAGCYLLGKYMQEYGDANKAAMAYNMGVSGAENAWAEGITSTDYSTAVVEAMERWEVTVNAWNGI